LGEVKILDVATQRKIIYTYPIFTIDNYFMRVKRGKHAAPPARPATGRTVEHATTAAIHNTRRNAG